MKKNLAIFLVVSLFHCTIICSSQSLDSIISSASTGFNSLIALEDSAPNSKIPDLPRRIKIPKIKGTVKLDGKLDDALWKKAALLSPFYNNDASAPARESTEIRIAYDDSALYISWQCLDADIQATYTERDSKLWEEEVAEMFVTPKELTRYFELQWNPLGTVFDAIINNQLDDEGLSKSFKGEWDFTAEGMKSAVWVDGTVQNSSDTDRVWQVEVIIPFASLSVSAPEPGDVWRANFYRYNRTKGKKEEHYSWSPTQLPSFHQPSRFGYLEFQPYYSGI